MEFVLPLPDRNIEVESDEGSIRNIPQATTPRYYDMLL